MPKKSIPTANPVDVLMSMPKDVLVANFLVMTEILTDLASEYGVCPKKINKKFLQKSQELHAACEHVDGLIN